MPQEFLDRPDIIAAFGRWVRDYALRFERKAHPKLQCVGITKPIAPERSLLAANLQTVLGVIKKHYIGLPIVKNVLLYLHNGLSISDIPKTAGSDFEVVSVDYSQAAFENFIRLKV